MKRILITGAGSYIGGSFERYLARKPEYYKVDTLDMMGNSWREKSFSNYDIIFHVAGIAHIKETPENADSYFAVNRDLTYNVAKKAVSEGVQQFIFLSSMCVYGINSGVITRDTKPSPNTNYGKSKLEAEQLLDQLSTGRFKICVLRPPIVYGNGCKGIYQTLANYALKFSVFPKFNNERSMIFIDNLCEFIKVAIDRELSGLYFPQNPEYVCASTLVAEIAGFHARNIKFTSLLNPLVKCALRFSEDTKKIFGSLVYADDTRGPNDIKLTDFKKSVFLTESKEPTKK